VRRPVGAFAEPHPDEAAETSEWVPPHPIERLRTRLRGNRQLEAGVLLLGLFGVVAVTALVRFGSGLGTLVVDSTLGQVEPPIGPSSAHPFGVMSGLGLDLLSALVQATPIDLALVGGSTLLAALLGIVLGSYAALAGGSVDALVTGVSDLLVGVPPFFFVMVLFLGLQPFLYPPDWLPLFGLLFALVLLPYHARPVRARAMEVTGEPYVEAARAAGATPARLLLRHVLPNSTSPALAQVPVDVYNFLFVLTAFPFLACFGAGSNGFFKLLSPLPSSNYPEWGFLLAQGACAGWSPLAQLNAWWMYTFPAAVVVAFGVAVALACDGLETYLAGHRATT
jgi:peptide/nickel transport system permease protein